jgi:hypothetical protein
MSVQVTRDNHYVPQSYLRSWSSDGNRIWCYRILVSNENVPLWKHESIKNIAYITDLYSSISNNDICDTYEKWIKKEYEDPGFEAICKLNNNEKLNRYDLEKLVRFLALQDIRTPCNYFETKERWNAVFPQVASEVIESAANQINKNNYDYFKRMPNKKTMFANIKAHVTPIEKDGKNYLSFEMEAPFNREAWIDEQKHLLEKTSKCLLKHSWSIFKSAKDISWFTSDHPVARCNYYSKYNWNLLGGWGNTKGNILMPLTPKYLLFTQIGDACEEKKTISAERTIEMNDILLARAYRYIFSVREINRVSKVRCRIVNKREYDEEIKFWESWKI